MKFNVTLHGDKITVGGVDAFTPVDGEYTSFDYLGETFDLTQGSGLRVTGSQGTVGNIQTDNLNGIHYVKQYMRGLEGVEGGLKFDHNNVDKYSSTNLLLKDSLKIYAEGTFVNYTIISNHLVRDTVAVGNNTLVRLFNGKPNLQYSFDGVVIVNFGHTDTVADGLSHSIEWYIRNVGADVVLSVTVDGVEKSITITGKQYIARSEDLNSYLMSATLTKLEFDDVSLNINNIIGTTVDSESNTLELATSHTDGDLYIDNQMHRAICTGDKNANKLSADIAFDNGATSDTIVQELEYTDSITETYYLNEGEGDTIYGLYGSRGTLLNETWYEDYTEQSERIIPQYLEFDSNNIEYVNV